MEKQIIIVAPGTLKPKDKEKLTKAGHIVIEHPSPHGGIKFQPQDSSEKMTFVYTNCIKCGERIYMLAERMSELKKYKNSFYCTQGHSQNYK